MTAVRDYVTAVVHRARRPMEPIGYQVDWSDAPRRHKVYPGAVDIPLPPADIPVGSLDDALAGAGPSGGVLDLASLSAMLRESYGLTARRLALHANDDAPTLPWYQSANWSRGTASGGGLYPVEVYWAAGPSGPLQPGVYNYSTARHTMQRLLTGDVTGQVRAALPGGPDAHADTDQFLLLSVKFWKNAFKYNSFSYHVVTMDVGTVLGTWQLWSRAHGTALRPAFWFDDPALDRLLGLHPDDESVFAVVPLPWGAPPVAPTPGDARVTATEVERSRTVIRFPRLREVHQAVVADQGAAPESIAPSLSSDAAPPAGDVVRLPPPARTGVGVTAALRARRSSFGRFTEQPGLSQPQLSALLDAGTVGGRLAGDAGDPVLTRLGVFVNHVSGLPSGAYDYRHDGRLLHEVRGGPAGMFLQRNYFLRNYNVEQAAAVITVWARPTEVVDAVGDRGYRLVNATVGSIAQHVYTAAAALGVGCGAALGFDNVSYVEYLGGSSGDGSTDYTTEWPLLMIMLGSERPRGADFDYRLV